MKPFVVSVADLLHRPGARRAEHLAGALPGIVLADTRVPDGSDLRLDLVLEPVQEGVLATGTAVAPWAAPCRRCLAPVAGELEAPFRELFEDEPVEGESYPLHHEQIDLEPLAREVVLLELPQAPLCREDCRGLCPRCGVDLNEGSCSCGPEQGDPRWAALDALRFDP